jgi:hypothetical protein
MKRTATTLAITLFTAGMSSPAVTQDLESRNEMPTVTSDRSGTMPAVDTRTGVGTGAAYEGIRNWAGVVSALQTGAGTPTDFSSVETGDDVEVAPLSDLDGATEVQSAALEEALSYREADVSDMRDAIEAHGTITAALDKAGHAADDLVAAVREVGGPVHLVVDDREG